MRREALQVSEVWVSTSGAGQGLLPYLRMGTTRRRMALGA